MDKFSRSKSSRDGGGVHPIPTSMSNLRSYSTSSYKPPPNLDYYNNKNTNFKDMKAKKDNNGPAEDSSKNNWGFNLDPELQRKKRVAGYKAYAVEGRMKGSMKKSFRWIKTTCNQVVHGFW